MQAIVVPNLVLLSCRCEESAALVESLSLPADVTYIAMASEESDVAPAGSAGKAHALNHALRSIYPSKSVIPPTDLVCLLATDKVRAAHF